MKYLFLILFYSCFVFADVKLSELPLGTAASIQPLDSFPYVAKGTNTTKRLTLYDIVNIPAMSGKFAPLLNGNLTNPTLSNPTLTGTITTPLDANKVIVTNAFNQLTTNGVTSTELGYLSGVTGAIQTQLGTKAPTESPTFTGTVGLQGATSGQVNLGAPSVVTSYSIKFPASQGLASQLLSNDGAGNLSWINPPATGANVTLSNLTTPTAINTNLLPASAYGSNVGNSSYPWNEIWSWSVEAKDAIVTPVLKIKELIIGGTDTININGPVSMAGSYDVTLPNQQGAANTVLTNDGSGTLSWASITIPPPETYTVTCPGTFTVPDGITNVLISGNTAGLCQVNLPNPKSLASKEIQLTSIRTTAENTIVGTTNMEGVIIYFKSQSSSADYPIRFRALKNWTGEDDYSWKLASRLKVCHRLAANQPMTASSTVTWATPTNGSFVNYPDGWTVYSVDGTVKNLLYSTTLINLPFFGKWDASYEVESSGLEVASAYVNAQMGLTGHGKFTGHPDTSGNLYFSNNKQNYYPFNADLDLRFASNDSSWTLSSNSRFCVEYQP